jgi:hypothetical protein
MKKIIFTASLVLICLVLVLNFSAFKNSDKKINANPYILVEIYEIPDYVDAGVHIHYGNAKTEVVKFKGFQKEHHDDNGDIILSAINKLQGEGYEITHTAAGVSSAGMITKVFMKKKD